MEENLETKECASECGTNANELIPESSSASQNENTRKVKITLWGEGMRIDVLDSAGDVIGCFNALIDDGLFEIQIDDEGEWRTVSKEDLGPDLGKFDDEDPDYNNDFTWNTSALWEPEEEFEDVESINSVQTKVYANVEIEVSADEPLDLKKIRMMCGEMILPDSEEQVYCGVYYAGKQYPIELDIETEREISVDEIWSL